MEKICKIEGCSNPTSTTRSKFCSHKCRMVDYRNRNRDRINAKAREYAAKHRIPKGRVEITKKCELESCSKEFTTTSPCKKFCSSQCSQKNWKLNNPERYKQSRHEMYKRNPQIYSLFSVMLPDYAKLMNGLLEIYETRAEILAAARKHFGVERLSRPLLTEFANIKLKK